MNKYVGICVGGPQDGQNMVHWAKTKNFYRPMISALVADLERAPVQTVDIGEYRLNDFGQWMWWPSEAGRAYDKLFGL